MMPLAPKRTKEELVARPRWADMEDSDSKLCSSFGPMAPFDKATDRLWESRRDATTGNYSKLQKPTTKQTSNNTPHDPRRKQNKKYAVVDGINEASFADSSERDK